MKYIDGFRNADVAASLKRRIAEQGTLLEKEGRRATIMEVCGTHTMTIARYGIRDLLPPNVDLVSGPGCPVCVTVPGYIDAAAQLAAQGVTLATFGDMLQVPGSRTTLADCRAAGADVEVCYSPRHAVELARARRDREVVFLAIGFETTIGPVTSLVDTAVREHDSNLSLLTAFKLIPPAMAALLADPEMRIDAFLCPAHVSAIIGPEAYEPLVSRHRMPFVIAGFEPLDVLYGLVGILAQLVRGEGKVENQYSRVVKPGGNPKARHLMERYLEPADASWRGLGALPGSGLALRPAYREFDAAARHNVTLSAGTENPACLCGEVIKGKRKPPDCPAFARACTPDHALGPCMVSAEGTCSAYFKYRRLPEGVS